MRNEVPRKMERAGGILLHPISLPSSCGIGDLGSAANRWLAWLGESGCGLWQMLPLGPPGYSESPYQSYSSFAGNPLLISLDGLVEDGLLAQQDLDHVPDFPPDRIAYNDVMAFKYSALDLAAERFFGGANESLIQVYETYENENRDWLDDFALFMALKEAHDGLPWTSWETELAARRPDAIGRAAEEMASSLDKYRFHQFVFSRQWQSVRQRARASGVELIGDLPIYVAHDSVDTWVHPELFQLDANGMPTYVAGVPPDYFSPTGQRWGNPLYRWEKMQANGFHWWIRRFRAVLRWVDLVRFDHFLGLNRYWQIPAANLTAEQGTWQPAPGEELLDKLQDALGGLPIIVEDLGLVTPEVEALRDRFGLPGMKILQFAFDGDSENPFLPDHYPSNCVAYTGTHDNDTARGWYENAPEQIRDRFRRYTGSDGTHVAWDMIRALWHSKADRTLAQMQDLLELGNEARMNVPGTSSGNWRWRMQESQLTLQLAEKLRALNETTDRMRG
ncbi:MAG: 4-alpha-glucanotransferase [Anaerolineales bacterium]|jgi:4-alpha-glucanotransferase